MRKVIDVVDGAVQTVRSVINPDTPPGVRALPSGTRTLYVAVKFERPPEGQSISIDVYNESGRVDIGAGLLLEERNTATGAYTLRMARQPTAGKFADGRYQARVKVDEEVVARVNWGIGESKDY